MVSTEALQAFNATVDRVVQELRTAAAAAGYDFQEWSVLVPVAPGNASVIMARPASEPVDQDELRPS